MMMIDRYVGIPFAAANCWQLIRRIYSAELGIVLPMHDTVDTDDGEALKKAIDDDTAGPLWWPVDLGQERLFDVLVMRGFYRDRETGALRSGEIHCGMALGGGRLIHVEPDGQSVAVPYTHPTVTPGRIKRIFRHGSLGR